MKVSFRSVCRWLVESSPDPFRRSVTQAYRLLSPEPAISKHFPPDRFDRARNRVFQMPGSKDTDGELRWLERFRLRPTLALLAIATAVSAAMIGVLLRMAAQAARIPMR